MKKIILSFVFFVQIIDATLINYSVSATIGWPKALKMIESGILNPNSIVCEVYTDNNDLNNEHNLSIYYHCPFFLLDMLSLISENNRNRLIRGFEILPTSKSYFGITVSMYDQPIPVTTVIEELAERGAIRTPFTKEILNRFPKSNTILSPITGELRYGYSVIKEGMIDTTLNRHKTFKAAVIGMRRRYGFIPFDLTNIIIESCSPISPKYLTRHQNPGRTLMGQIFNDLFISKCSNPDTYLNGLDPSSDFLRPPFSFFEERYDNRKERINKLLTAPEDANLILQTRQKTPFYFYTTPQFIQICKTFQMPQFRQIATGALFLTPVIAASLSKS